VVEGGCSGGGDVDFDGVCECGAFADDYDVWVAVCVKSDSEAWDGVVALGAGEGFGFVDFDYDCSSEYWSVC